MFGKRAGGPPAAPAREAPTTLAPQPDTRPKTEAGNGRSAAKVEKKTAPKQAPKPKAVAKKQADNGGRSEE